MGRLLAGAALPDAFHGADSRGRLGWRSYCRRATPATRAPRPIEQRMYRCNRRVLLGLSRHFTRDSGPLSSPRDGPFLRQQAVYWVRWNRKDPATTSDRAFPRPAIWPAREGAT